MRCFLAISLLLLASPHSAFAAVPPAYEYWQSYLLSQINESRREQDLLPLGLDQEFTEVAQSHADDMAAIFDDTDISSMQRTYIKHQSSDGRSFADRIHGSTIQDLRSAGENVGYGHQKPITELHKMIKETIDFIHSSMMAEVPPEDGHRKNILGDFSHVGIGLSLNREASSKQNSLFLVTDFGVFNSPKVVHIPLPGSPPPPYFTGMEQREEPAPLSPWAEKNRTRLLARRSERLLKLMQRVEERKKARLQRRGF